MTQCENSARTTPRMFSPSKPDQTLVGLYNRCLDRLALIVKVRPALEEIIAIANIDRLN